MPRGVPKSGKRKRRVGTAASKVGKATLRLGAYGSTRYTSKGASPKRGSRNVRRAKGVGTNIGAGIAGNVGSAAAGAAIGKAMTKKGASGGKQAAAGAAAGYGIGIAAQAAGRKISRSRGYTKRTKQRMSVRAVKKVTRRKK